MPAVVLILILVLALGIGGQKESPKVTQRVNLKVEVDSQGKASTKVGYDVEAKGSDTTVKIGLENR